LFSEVVECGEDSFTAVGKVV